MKKLLSSGYFPSELPPPFHTTEFAQHITSTPLNAPYTLSATREPSVTSRPVTYNLARPGKLRRTLSIPNPVNFYLLAAMLSALRPVLTQCYSGSNQALSKPRRTLLRQTDKRAYEWTHPMSSIQDRRSDIRTGMRYVLQTDINNFYPSIYTHSIPWALHGKAHSQSHIGWNVLQGNNIDRLIQISQQKQTKGIPIGPDTSYLIAEVILSTLDRQLVSSIGSNYFRYMDDYEFAFKTHTQAETGLSAFQESLGTYELVANEAKTRIIELPACRATPYC